jgi:hypothetical protein
MSALEILGTAASLSLLAGWRLYATVLAVGLAVRFDWWRLPEKLNNLNVLAKDWVLVVAGLGFLCEFFADKIPWLDSIWDSVHTFVRPVGGALVAWSLISPQDHEMQVIYFLLGGGMALLSHATKATTPAVVNQSPEPFSNIAVSLVEDAAVAGGIWLTMTHPLIVLGISLVLTVFFIWLIRKLWRFFRSQLDALRSLWNRLFSPSPA